MALLTANAGQATIKRGGDDILAEYPVGADVHIWHNGFVGIDPAGNAKAFQAGDRLVGIACGEANNNVSGETNAAGDINVVVHTWTDFQVNLASAAITDVGRSVFATTDNQDDVSFIGHPDAFVGVFIHLDADSGDAVIRMLTPGIMPADGRNGQASLTVTSGHEALDTGVGIAFSLRGVTRGGILSIQQLGGGIEDDTVAGHLLQADAVAEIATVSMESKGGLDGALGMTFEGDINVENLGDAAVVDFDWGFVDEHTEAVRESMITARNRVLFHMDQGSPNILAESDNESVVVAPTDTTIDNVTTSGAWKNFKVIARIDGVCELWIDNVRILSSTVFAINPARATYRGVVNQEKTSDDTLASTMVRRLRIAGVAAH